MELHFAYSAGHLLLYLVIYGLAATLRHIPRFVLALWSDYCAFTQRNRLAEMQVACIRGTRHVRAYSGQ